jgi:hypothetical protein
MSEPRARAAESGRQGELHVKVHSSPRSGEALLGARRMEISRLSPHRLMVHQ